VHVFVSVYSFVTAVLWFDGISCQSRSSLGDCLFQRFLFLFKSMSLLNRKTCLLFPLQEEAISSSSTRRRVLLLITKAHLLVKEHDMLSCWTHLIFVTVDQLHTNLLNVVPTVFQLCTNFAPTLYKSRTNFPTSYYLCIKSRLLNDI
jgi:hypothetical protein